jgi:succinoglycan biosynthesis protein ExoV
MAVTVHYFRSDPPNFGDELNAVVWETLIPELRETDFDAVLVGIGTILDRNIPQDRQVFVLGAGAGNAPLPARLDGEKIHVLSVRGPLTARLAGLPAHLAITDPALLLRAIYPQFVGLGSRSSSGKTLFMPHVATAKDDSWRRACERAGIELVDPTEHCLTTLRKIASARLVIAEAMHAAIVADAFGVPWIPVASTRLFSTFKWVDWALSMQVPFRPVLLPAASVRHWCKRVWFSMFAERCLNADVSIGHDPSEEGSDAVERLLRETAQRLASPPARPIAWLRLKLAAFYNRVLDPVISIVGRTLLRTIDDRMERRIARILSDLATKQGYRSKEDVAVARLQALQDRVSGFRDVLALHTPPGTIDARTQSRLSSAAG